MQVSTVATTATLAEQNRGEELKRVCLEFISKNLSAVMVTDGYQHMMTTCPEIQVRKCTDTQIFSLCTIQNTALDVLRLLIQLWG